MRTRTIAIVVLWSAAGAYAGDMSARELVARANQEYREGNYAAALADYGQAEVALPESPEVAYNQGLAYYQTGDYAAAKNYLNRALLTRNLNLEAGVKYNLGNVAYASALEKMSDLQEAIELLKQAISHYRDGLELNPDDEDAQANIQTAQLLIKDLLDKLKQQQEKQQQQQQQGDQSQQDQQQQDQSPQQQGQQGQQEQKDEQQQGDQEEQPEGEQKSPEQQGQQDQQPQESQADEQGAQTVEAQEMTREEADRLLQSVRDKERQRQEEQARRMRVHRAPVQKDW